MNRGRNEAEDRVVSRVYMNMTLEELKKMGADLRKSVQSFLKNEISVKDLKKNMGDLRIVYMAHMFSRALEDGNIKEIEAWGSKIEEYCIQKPKPDTGDSSSGADRLMEAIANVIDAKAIIKPAMLNENNDPKGTN